MKKLYFYCNQPTITRNKPFDSYNDCVKYYKNNIKHYNKLMTMTGVFDEDEKLVVNDKSFYFQLHARTHYITRILMSDILYYFSQELENAGFTINRMCESNKLISKTRKDLKNLNTQAKDIEFEKLVLQTSNTQFIHDTEYYKRAEFLNCLDCLTEYKDFIVNTATFDNYLNFERMLNYKQAIVTKIKNKQTNFKIELFDSQYNKVLLLKQFEEYHDIKPMDINTEAKTVTKDKDLIFQINKRFRLNIANDDTRTAYIKMIRNLCAPIIDATRVRNKNNTKIRVYSYNKTNLETFLSLLELRLEKQELCSKRNDMINSLYKYIDKTPPHRDIDHVIIRKKEIN